jgi:hypothetical protein
MLDGPYSCHLCLLHPNRALHESGHMLATTIAAFRLNWHTIHLTHAQIVYICHTAGVWTHSYLVYFSVTKHAPYAPRTPKKYIYILLSSDATLSNASIILIEMSNRSPRLRQRSKILSPTKKRVGARLDFTRFTTTSHVFLPVRHCSQISTRRAVSYKQNTSTIFSPVSCLGFFDYGIVPIYKHRSTFLFYLSFFADALIQSDLQ